MREPDIVFREHWRVLVGPVVVLFVTVGAGSFLASMAPDRDERGWARIAVFVIVTATIARWTVMPWLRWLTDRHIVTGGRLVVRRGVWTREEWAMPLARVADVTYTQDSVFERLLGIGDLVVLPDDDRDPVELIGVPHVARSQEQLLRRVDLARDVAYYAARNAGRAFPGASADAVGRHHAGDSVARSDGRVVGEGAPPGRPPADPDGDRRGPVR